MKKLMTVFLATLIIGLPWAAAADKFEGALKPFLGEPRMDVQPLFKAIRHPNIVVTVKGTVLATLGDKKLLARRSEDGGKTWGKEI